jgi:hypothetical protein
MVVLAVWRFDAKADVSLSLAVRGFASERRGDGAVANDVVTGIYRIYAGPKGDYRTGSIEDKRIAVLFTASLRKALAAMNVRSRKSK